MAETNYIPLSRNLLADPKVKALQRAYGDAAGVGHWALLLLEMYGSSLPAIDLNTRFLREAIMDDHGMTADELDGLCTICANVGLIDPLLWEKSRQVCNAHVNDQKAAWLEDAEKRSNAGRKGGKASGASRSASSKRSSGASRSASSAI